MPSPLISQHLIGAFPRSRPASLAAFTTAAKMAGKSPAEWNGVLAATPAALTTASQLLLRMATLMASLSVADPTTIESRLDLTSAESLEGDRTKATTLWLWAMRAGSSREPTLPVTPSKRTFILAGCRMK